MQKEKFMKYKPKYQMTEEDTLFWAKRNIVDYVWKSANLEGIGVTFPETWTICEGMSVGKKSIDDINAVVQLKKAWQKVFETLDEPITLDYIKKIHRILGKMTVINAGSIRWHEVGIRGTEYKPAIPEENQLEIAVEKILTDDSGAINQSFDLMLYLCRTQAFYDGNKRIAMMIANKHMIANGMGVISVCQEDKEEFFHKLIEFYETNNSVDIKDFLYAKCIDGIDMLPKSTEKI
jgi:prophage maintenance system killer protein